MNPEVLNTRELTRTFQLVRMCEPACAHVRACVRTRVHKCMYMHAFACVQSCACVRACVRTCVRAYEHGYVCDPRLINVCT